MKHIGLFLLGASLLAQSVGTSARPIVLHAARLHPNFLLQKPVDGIV